MTMISIITPANKPILQRTIDSIANQTNKDFEWIVVNDGYYRVPFSHFNEDGTVNTLYDKIKLVTLTHEFGASVARNVGFQVSDGDVITYLDADDELSHDRVANLISIFSTYPIDLLFNAYIINQEGHSHVLNHFDYVGQDKHFRDFSEYLRLIQTQNISIPMGVAHGRKLFMEAGGFQRGIVCGEDGILWRRMVNKLPLFRILFDSTIAGTYYVNQSGQSRTQKRPEMGGFAFDGSRNDNGRYLDEHWFNTYNSVPLFDKE